MSKTRACRGTDVLGRPRESDTAESECHSDAVAGRGCAEPRVFFNARGLYCLNCHASAIANSGTYSSTAYLNPPSAGSLADASTMIEDMHNVSSRDSADVSAAEQAPMNVNRVPNSSSPISDLCRPTSPPCMVSQALDHVVPAGESKGGPEEFLTSDQCAIVTTRPARSPASSPT